jgi:hypothetical protein
MAQAQVDLRVHGPEPPQALGQPLDAEGRGQAQRQRAPARRVAQARRLPGNGVERLAGHAHQRPALLGQRQLAGHAPEQGHTQVRFQQLDLMADRRLGDEELLGGLGEGQMARPGLEGAERVERRQTAGQGFLYESIFLIYGMNIGRLSSSLSLIIFSITQRDNTVSADSVNRIWIRSDYHDYLV